MKITIKLLMFAFCIAILTSCGPSAEELQNRESGGLQNRESGGFQERQIVLEVGIGIKVATIDSCEYILYSGNGKAICHKQNCKFCKQRSEN